jgi:hypothetical protein
LYSGPRPLFPQHLDDGDQRTVARRLGDPDMEELVAGQRLRVRVELALHRGDRVSIAAICVFFADFAASAAHSLSITWRARSNSNGPASAWTRRRRRHCALALRAGRRCPIRCGLRRAFTSSAISASRTDGRDTPSCLARSRSGRKSARRAGIRPSDQTANLLAICRYSRRGSMLWNGMANGGRRRRSRRAAADPDRISPRCGAKRRRLVCSA